MEQICANNMDTKGVTSGMIYHHIRKSVEDNENYTLGFFYTNWQETVSQSVFTPTSCLWTNRTRIVCDIAYPSVWRVDTKNEGKINKYLDLAIQIKELRKMKSVNLSSLLSSTGCYSEETGGLPEKHKCWDRIDSTSKNSLAGISKDPPRSPLSLRQLVAT